MCDRLHFLKVISLFTVNFLGSINFDKKHITRIVMPSNFTLKVQNCDDCFEISFHKIYYPKGLYDYYVADDMLMIIHDPCRLIFLRSIVKNFS
jgi:hypothetical protein